MTKISQLRKSLSQLLSKYYPFAGRLEDKITIECNDHGVSFLVTKIKKQTIRDSPKSVRKIAALVIPPTNCNGNIWIGVTL
jgi:hypothetical protein